ncbi:hypothetical protein [Azospirillum sp. SYSU D00513]|uniref:hypothetical protein n=1 Tax=Azospirillum sp. SYSU D00513 TaxID=2812561 RepID=UPI001A95988B|nr:hypothetical protein [Azospirillum sp. SYSU D00513]
MTSLELTCAILARAVLWLQITAAESMRDGSGEVEDAEDWSRMLREADTALKALPELIAGGHPDAELVRRARGVVRRMDVLPAVAGTPIATVVAWPRPAGTTVGGFAEALDALIDYMTLDTEDIPARVLH